MKIKILPIAIEDLYNGRQFYERQNEGVGDYFFDSLFSDIDSLNLYSGIHPVFFGYYRMLSKRFPFAIYYKFANKETIIIYRVLDMRRNPLKLKNEL